MSAPETIPAPSASLVAELAAKMLAMPHAKFRVFVRHVTFSALPAWYPAACHERFAATVNELATESASAGADRAEASLVVAGRARR